MSRSERAEGHFSTVLFELFSFSMDSPLSQIINVCALKKNYPKEYNLFSLFSKIGCNSGQGGLTSKRYLDLNVGAGTHQVDVQAIYSNSWDQTRRSKSECLQIGWTSKSNQAKKISDNCKR